MSRPWFNTKECSLLDIKMYQSISRHHVVRAVTVADQNVIASIMDRIETIPADGDMMVSFGPDAEHIELGFTCVGNATQTINIYQKRFKTPSTGFNSRGKSTELALYADIDALLFPAPNKKMLKIKNLEISFHDFSLTYLGEKHSEKAPVTAAWVADEFRISPLDAPHEEQLISISSGQLSPAPYNFTIGKNLYRLLTYEAQTIAQPNQNLTPPSGPTEPNERLYPDYFQVVMQ